MSSMKTGFVVSCVLLVLALIIAGSSSAEIPQKINYQGRLTDNVTGEPKVGTHNFAFRIYDDPFSGSPLWDESQTLVADSAGVISAVLGRIVPIDIGFDSATWLEVEVDGEVLSPRREIVSVPYAFRAIEADSLGGEPASAYDLKGEPG